MSENEQDNAACDHIIGFDYGYYTDDEEKQLVNLSDGYLPSEPFNYCPLCGKKLV